MQIPHALPYLLLMLLFTSLFVCICLVKRKNWLPVLLLVYSGMIDIFEYTVLIVLHAYEYNPGLLPIPYYDNLIGALISNVVTVPVLALLIAVFQLGMRWILSFTLLLAMIEWTFLHLGVYRLNWWRIPYSMASFIFFFWLSRLWLQKLKQRQAAVRFVSLWMFVSSMVNLSGFTLANFHIRLFHPGVFADVYRDDAFFGNLYSVAVSLILVIILYLTKRLLWRVAGIGIILILVDMLIFFGLLRIYVSVWAYQILVCGIQIAVLLLAVYAKRQIAGISSPD